MAKYDLSDVALVEEWRREGGVVMDGLLILLGDLLFDWRGPCLLM